MAAEETKNSSGIGVWIMPIVFAVLTLMVWMKALGDRRTCSSKIPKIRAQCPGTLSKWTTYLISVVMPFIVLYFLYVGWDDNRSDKTEEFPCDVSHFSEACAKVEEEYCTILPTDVSYDQCTKICGGSALEKPSDLIEKPYCAEWTCQKILKAESYQYPFKQYTLHSGGACVDYCVEVLVGRVAEKDLPKADKTLLYMQNSYCELTTCSQPYQTWSITAPEKEAIKTLCDPYCEANPSVCLDVSCNTSTGDRPVECACYQLLNNQDAQNKERHLVECRAYCELTENKSSTYCSELRCYIEPIAFGCENFCVRNAKTCGIIYTGVQFTPYINLGIDAVSMKPTADNRIVAKNILTNEDMITSPKYKIVETNRPYDDDRYITYVNGISTFYFKASGREIIGVSDISKATKFKIEQTVPVENNPGTLKIRTSTQQKITIDRMGYMYIGIRFSTCCDVSSPLIQLLSVQTEDNFNTFENLTSWDVYLHI
jgi:hypothetical protein